MYFEDCRNAGELADAICDLLTVYGELTVDGELPTYSPTAYAIASVTTVGGPYGGTFETLRQAYLDAISIIRGFRKKDKSLSKLPDTVPNQPVYGLVSIHNWCRSVKKKKTPVKKYVKEILDAHPELIGHAESKVFDLVNKKARLAGFEETTKNSVKSRVAEYKKDFFLQKKKT